VLSPAPLAWTVQLSREPRKVIVPSAMKGEMVCQSLHRNLKHISVVVCISAAGEHMMLFFVSSQANGSVQRRLQVDGSRLGTDLIIKQRDKPYMNVQLFAKYISTVFIPYVEELRSLEKFAASGSSDG
jgi:hypothetical protein